jgi:GWxTD domain-containing protein
MKRTPGSRSRPAPAAVCLALALLAASAAAPSCRLYRMERGLSPAYADFYSKVRYIITRQERKIFLELPDAEKGKFIEEFWERRNPYPGTPTNAFETEYLNRIARADTLFLGEGRAGYLTDRGRIYVLFGPPMERMTYPMEANGDCREVWYYGAFPVIFVDEYCQGHYVLTAINLEHLQALNIAQGNFQKTITGDKRFFDYNVSFEAGDGTEGAPDGTVVIDVPYERLWFTSVGERLETSLDVALEAEDESGERIWETRREYPLAMSEEGLRASQGKNYRIEIPFTPDTQQGPAGERRIRILVRVKNGTGDEELKKELGVRLARPPACL